MRFQCSFCVAIIDTDKPAGSRISCSSCGQNCFIPKSRFETNSVIGDFVLREKIGSGSLGTVYKAIQLSLEREVALKILSPELSSPKFVASFLREARAAAKLSHANLVRAYAVGEDNGICYLAMSYIKGETLRDKLEREGKIPVDEALHIIQQVAEALFYAWEEALLIHRDVKPDNIMITDEGVVKLTDLGLAINQSEWTEDMEISGSPSYMSPEQFSGEKLDTRSDIYSMGITLYQMISGQLPFNGENFQEVAQQHFNDPAPSLAKLDNNVPAKVSILVSKMMEKLPEDRHENVEILLKNIWTARQITAPNQDLVPDVHTISINRLDYDLQEKFKNEQNASTVITARNNPRQHVFALLIVVLTGCIFLAVILFRSPRENEPETTAIYERSLQRIINKFNSQSHHPSVLAVEVDNLISHLPNPLESSRQEVVFWQLHYYKEKINAAKKEIELAEKLAHIARLEGRMKSEMNGKKNVNEQLLQNQMLLEKQLKESQKNIATMTQKIEKLTGKVEQQQQIIVKTNAQHKALLQENDLLTFGRLLVNRNFRNAQGYLQYRRHQCDDAYQSWLDRYLKWLKVIETLENFLSGSVAKVPGYVFDQGKRVTMMTSGIIYYEEPSTGISRSRSVYDFPASSIYNLVKKVRPNMAGKENIFCANYSFLAGQLESPHITKGNPCVLELTKILLFDQVRSMQILATYDIDSARRESEEFQIRFQASPLYKNLFPMLKEINRQKTDTP